jgi:hypothetical protein
MQLRISSALPLSCTLRRPGSDAAGSRGSTETIPHDHRNSGPHLRVNRIIQTQRHASPTVFSDGRNADGGRFLETINPEREVPRTPREIEYRVT